MLEKILPRLSSRWREPLFKAPRDPAESETVTLVLIIEDEKDLRSGLAQALSRAQFDVAEAEDGEEGYAAILALRPDLVLCDISMPGLRGDQLLRRLRRDHPDLDRTPFLFLTALADRDSVLAGQEMGADDYLTKPVDLKLLIGLIRQRLDQAERWGQSYLGEFESERRRFLDTLSARTRLSFLSAADVLNRLGDAVLLFNGSAELVFANRAARRLLDQDDGIVVQNGRLVATRGEDTRRIRDLLKAIPGGGPGQPSLHLSIERPSGRRPYAMRIARLESGPGLDDGSGALAAVFLSDPEVRPRPSEASLVELYGLTQAEARTVADLATGLSVDEAAEMQHISRNTVHHYLKAAFRKTGTTRQSEMIAVVLSSATVEPGADDGGGG